jgi:hypothetical protein
MHYEFNCQERIFTMNSIAACAYSKRARGQFGLHFCPTNHCRLSTAHCTTVHKIHQGTHYA